MNQHLKNPEKLEDWIEEFDMKFPFAIIDWKIGKENDGDGVSEDKMKQIKSFISTKFAERYEQGRKDETIELNKAWQEHQAKWRERHYEDFKEEFLNQKANQHDQEVRKQCFKEVKKMVEGMKEKTYMNYCGDECIDQALSDLLKHLDSKITSE